MNNDGTNSRKSFSGNLGRVLVFFAVLVGLGIVGIVLSAGAKREIAVFLIWSVACLLSGALVGFLFGVPKISQIDAALKGKPDVRTYRQLVNTNLEKISDWLTTIIVGLGLYQLSKIPRYLIALADFLNGGSAEGHQRAFSLAITVYFTILGFLFGYLATRLFLSGLFAQADKGATEVVELIKETAQRISPELLSQVLSKAPTEAIIEGEQSFQSEKRDNVGVQFSDVDEEPETSDDEKRDLDKTFEKLTKKTGE